MDDDKPVRATWPKFVSGQLNQPGTGSDRASKWECESLRGRREREQLTLSSVCLCIVERGCVYD